MENGDVNKGAMCKTPTRTLHAWFQSAQNSQISTSTPNEADGKKRQHVLVSQTSSDLSMDEKRMTMRSDSLVEQNKVCNTSLDSKLDAIHKSLMNKLNEVQGDINKLSQKVDTIEQQSNENKNNINENKAEIEELKRSIEFAHSEISELKKIKPVSDTPFVGMTKTQRKELDKQKAYSSRHNIIYEGVRYERNEDCVRKIDIINSDYLGLPGARYEIDKAHRTGPKRGSKPRDIIVRFKSHRAADITYERRKGLKGSGLWIKRDVPARLERESRLIEKVLPMAKDMDKSARVVQGNKLMFKGKIFDTDNLSTTGLPLHQIHQKETENTIYFKGQLTPLSNFFQTPITIQNIRFHSVEQFYQAEKARRHGDRRNFMAIMEEYDPAEIKSLAKKIVQNPAITREAEMEANIQSMETALHEKFKSPEMKDFLIQTGTKVLAEASFDDIWGTGVDFYKSNCTTIDYKGQNKLGKMLMDLRSKLDG